MSDAVVTVSGPIPMRLPSLTSGYYLPDQVMHSTKSSSKEGQGNSFGGWLCSTSSASSGAITLDGQRLAEGPGGNGYAGQTVALTRSPHQKHEGRSGSPGGDIHSTKWSAPEGQGQVVLAGSESGSGSKPETRNIPAASNPTSNESNGEDAAQGPCSPLDRAALSLAIRAKSNAARDQTRQSILEEHKAHQEDDMVELVESVEDLGAQAESVARAAEKMASVLEGLQRFKQENEVVKALLTKAGGSNNNIRGRLQLGKELIAVAVGQTSGTQSQTEQGQTEQSQSEEGQTEEHQFQVSGDEDGEASGSFAKVADATEGAGGAEDAEGGKFAEEGGVRARSGASVDIETEDSVAERAETADAESKDGEASGSSAKVAEEGVGAGSGASVDTGTDDGVAERAETADAESKEPVPDISTAPSGVDSLSAPLAKLEGTADAESRQSVPDISTAPSGVDSLSAPPAKLEGTADAESKQSVPDISTALSGVDSLFAPPAEVEGTADRPSAHEHAASMSFPEMSTTPQSSSAPSGVGSLSAPLAKVEGTAPGADSSLQLSKDPSDLDAIQSRVSAYEAAERTRLQLLEEENEAEWITIEEEKVEASEKARLLVRQRREQAHRAYSTAIVKARRQPSSRDRPTAPSKDGVYTWPEGPPKAGEQALFLYNKGEGSLKSAASARVIVGYDGWVDKIKQLVDLKPLSGEDTRRLGLSAGWWWGAQVGAPRSAAVLDFSPSDADMRAAPGREPTT
eukprot:gene18936-25503_t